jgi:hypothetical protein
MNEYRFFFDGGGNYKKKKLRIITPLKVLFHEQI